MLFDRSKFKAVARLFLPNSHPYGVTRELVENDLSLPMCSHTEEETGATAIFNAGRDLARQSDWEELSRLVMIHDRDRDMTPAGTPLAELLCAGARADVSMAMQAAARLGKLTPSNNSVIAVQDICDDLSDPDLGYGGAVIAADLMMEAGWAWYQQGAYFNQPERHLQTFLTLFAQAEKRLDAFCALDKNAPALAAAQCALLAGQTDAKNRVLDEYEDLIDLNPRAPGHMRAFGLHLLPQWFGGYDVIELQARRVAAHTERHWGAGGYTWMWLDALAICPAGFAYLDTEFFLEGIDDILARKPDQHFVNLFAAYLSRYLDTGDIAPDDDQRRMLERRRSGLLRGRMEELHLWVWANGPLAGTVKMHIADKNRSTAYEDGWRLARGALAHVFAHEIALVLPDGPVAHAPSARS